MTAIGASGIDLYARDPAGKWRWAAVTRPAGKVVRQFIINDLTPGVREYAAYLPLYNGVDELSIGVPPGAQFERLAPRTEKPIVFYGTSITHGASASRPGMVHTAILGRRFDRPVVNLGFSGNGRMDAAVGELLVKIDAAVYVIDCHQHELAAFLVDGRADVAEVGGYAVDSDSHSIGHGYRAGSVRDLSAERARTLVLEHCAV